VPVAVSLPSGMRIALLWYGMDRDQGFLSVAATPLSVITGFVIVLKLSSRARSVRCALYVRFMQVSGALVVLGGWVGSTIAKWFICVEVLFRGDQIGGDGPL